MALWTKNEEKQTPSSATTGGPTGPKASRQTSGSVLGSGLRWEGRVSGGEDVRLEGSFVGELALSSGQVTVASGCEVQANLKAKTVVVEGKVNGEVNGKETVIVRRGATVEGNISAPRVILEDGCRVTGAIDMAGGGAASAGTPPATGPKAVVGGART